MRQIPALVIALLAASPALAQPAAAPKAPPPLQGPAVTEAPAKPTLVERDFAGKLKRLETSPEEAALALLTLDEETRSKTQAVLAERTAILDKIVLDNLDLVIQIHNARQSGSRIDQLVLLGDFVKAMRPLNDRGTLADELLPVLPLAQGADFRALVREYNQAATAEIVAEAKSRGERLTPRQAATRESLIVLGQEVKRSYERQITSKTAEFEAIIAQLNLDPDQDSKIRNLVLDYAQEVKGKPTADQRRAVFFKIMALLDSEQQRTLVRLFRIEGR
jgi:hypothetical protein